MFENKTVKLHYKYLGTLSACLFSLALFLSLSLLTAITCDPTLLFHDCNYMSTISIWSPIVAIGVLLATFRWVSSTPLGFLSRLLKVSKIQNGLSEDFVMNENNFWFLPKQTNLPNIDFSSRQKYKNIFIRLWCK